MDCNGFRKWIEETRPGRDDLIEKAPDAEAHVNGCPHCFGWLGDQIRSNIPEPLAQVLVPMGQHKRRVREVTGQFLDEVKNRRGKWMTCHTYRDKFDNERVLDSSVTEEDIRDHSEHAVYCKECRVYSLSRLYEILKGKGVVRSISEMNELIRTHGPMVTGSVLAFKRVQGRKRGN